MKKIILVSTIIFITPIFLYFYFSSSTPLMINDPTFVDSKLYPIKEQKLVADALNAEDKYQWQKAINIYTTILKQYPERVDLWSRVADIQNIYLHDSNLTAFTYVNVANLRPEVADFQYNAGLYFNQANNEIEAMKYFNRAVVLEPSNIKYLSAQLITANAINNLELVHQVAHKILKIDPNNSKALLAEANYYSQLNQLKSAIPIYQNYLQLYPNNPSAWRDYIQTLVWDGDYLSALDVLNKHKEQLNNNEYYFVLNAFIYAMLGEKDKSHAALKEMTVTKFNDASWQSVYDTTLKILSSGVTPKPVKVVAPKNIKIIPQNGKK